MLTLPEATKMRPLVGSRKFWESNAFPINDSETRW